MCETVFEALQACFLALFIDLGFANVLALVDVADCSFAEFEDVERFVDFLAIDAEDAFFGDACLVEDTEDFLIWFERSIAPAGALDRAVLPVDGLIVMYPIEEHVADLGTEVAGVALNVRAQRIEIDERGRLDLVECVGIMAFERIDQ